MIKSKLDFISDLLSSKGLDSAMKEKVFELVSKEFRNFSTTDPDVLRDIDMIKKKLGISEPSPGKNVQTDVIQKLDEYHDPRNISRFLLEYNQNTVLKSTTHNIDSNLLISLNEHLGIDVYDFNKHLAAIKSEFSTLTSKYSITKSLWTKISAYINGTGLWSTDSIKMSWSSAELSAWAQQNLGMCPNPEEMDLRHQPFAFERIRLANGEVISNFCGLTLYFKKQLTIRSDNNLYDLCRLWNFKFRERVLSFNLVNVPRNIEFFTDTEKLQQAYSKIIDMCCTEAEETQRELPIIEIRLTEQPMVNGDTVIVLSITHANISFNKTINATIQRYGTKFTGLINKQLNGICDWELVANFGNDQCARIMLWPRIGTFERLEQCLGVTFNLIFYR